MGKKRIRTPRAKPGELLACWGRASPGEKPSVVYLWGGGGSERADGRVLCNALEEMPLFGGGSSFDQRTLVQELEARGYDITTLRFSVRRKAPPGPS